MVAMSNRVNTDGTLDRAATADVPVPMDGTETVECYEVDEDVVLYDAENPLAWIQADSAVTITDAV
jgi:hypothetical protein